MKKITLLLLIGLMITLCSSLFADARGEVSIDINPNPVKDDALITATAQTSMNVNIVITDSKGIVLKTIYVGDIQPGANHFTWDRTDYTGTVLPSGKYILELTTTELKYTSVKKIIILK